jgi:hypothetical protein
VAVRLLVVQDNVHEALLVLFDAGRLGHDVELADLRVALQHLDGLGVVGHVERIGRDDAAAAEGARGEALWAGLEVDDGGWASLLESVGTRIEWGRVGCRTGVGRVLDSIAIFGNVGVWSGRRT